MVFGNKAAQPLLGAVTLETFSWSIDPASGRLMPVDALMLGTSACRGVGRLTGSGFPVGAVRYHLAPRP